MTNQKTEKPDARPNFALRRTLLGAGLGVLGVTGFLGIRAAGNAHSQDALNAELSQPLPDVAAEIRSGEINPEDVTRFKVGDTDYAWSIASEHTREDHQLDTGTVSSIIEAQQGGSVQGGSQIILPNSEIDQPAG